MGKSKRRNKGGGDVPEEFKVSKEEENVKILFEFVYYLENLDRAPVKGATQLLRAFLTERNE